MSGQVNESSNALHLTGSISDSCVNSNVFSMLDCSSPSAGGLIRVALDDMMRVFWTTEKAARLASSQLYVHTRCAGVCWAEPTERLFRCCPSPAYSHVALTIITSDVAKSKFITTCSLIPVRASRRHIYEAKCGILLVHEGDDIVVATYSHGVDGAPPSLAISNGTSVVKIVRIPYTIQHVDTRSCA